MGSGEGGKRKIFKGADEKLKNFDYAGAYKSYEEGFMNAQNLWNGTEPEYKEAVKGREEAFLKNKRLNELVPHVQRAAEDMPGRCRSMCCRARSKPLTKPSHCSRTTSS